MGEEIYIGAKGNFGVVGVFYMMIVVVVVVMYLSCIQCILLSKLIELCMYVVVFCV